MNHNRDQKHTIAILAGYGALALLVVWMLFSSIEGLSTWLSWVFLGLAVAAGIVYLVLDRQQIKEFWLSPRTRKGLQISVTLFLVAGILVLLYYVTQRHTILRLDLTANRRFSLSQQSQQVLKNLKEKVRFVVFKQKPPENAPADLVERYRSLMGFVSGLEFKLKEFQAQNRLISVESVDMQEEFALTKKYNITVPGSVLVLAGKKSMVLTIDDYIKMQQVGQQLQPVPFFEGAITASLINLTRKRRYTVYASSGHGERDLYKSDPSGASILRNALEQEGLEIRVTNLNRLKQQSIPADCDLLLVAGGSDAFFPAEIKLIEDYLMQGRPALFLVERDAGAELKQMLSRWGVTVYNEVVLSLDQYVVSGMIEAHYQQHPVTKALMEEKRRMVMIFPCSLDQSPITKTGRDPASGKPMSAFEVGKLLVSSENSWGERDATATLFKGQNFTGKPDPVERKGALTLALAITRGAQKLESKQGKTIVTQVGPEKNTRLVVIGDSEFVLNQHFPRYSGNKNFLLNCVSWAMGREKGITIRPKNPVSYPLFLAPRDVNFIMVFSIVIMPLLVLIPGILVALRRKRNG